MADPRVYDESSIEILKGLEPVRVRPTLFVGRLDAPDLPVRLLRQALCHAVDCATDGGCTKIEIQTTSDSARIAYDAGLPLDVHPHSGGVIARDFLTVLQACRNLKKHIAVGDELCDFGLAVLTALSAQLRVHTIKAGKTGTYTFVQGKEVGNAQITPTSEPDGTTMWIALDSAILGDNIRFDPELIRETVGRVQARLPSLSLRFACT